MNIVLIGFKSVGKSTVGRLLARQLRLRFVDLDDVIEDLFFGLHGIRLGFRECFKRYGAVEFRRIEAEALRQLAGEKGIVLATGGGAPLQADNRTLIADIGTVVYLMATPESLHQRLLAVGMPAYLQDDPSFENMLRVWNLRHPLYEQLASVVVEADGLIPDEIVNKICRAVQS